MLSHITVSRNHARVLENDDEAYIGVNAPNYIVVDANKSYCEVVNFRAKSIGSLIIVTFTVSNLTEYHKGGKEINMCTMTQLSPRINAGWE